MSAGQSPWTPSTGYSCTASSCLPPSTMARPLALLLLATVGGKKVVIEKSEGILILTEENYDKAVEEFDNMLVYFYAPW